MMKYMLVGLFCLIGATELVAQNFKYEESAPFIEPEVGWLKLLQLKNGNTALLHITTEEGINLKLFDASHKVKVEKVLRPKYGDKGKLPKYGSTAITGVLNVGNDIVLFVASGKDKTPILIRIIIDGQTGVLKSEEEIGSLKKMNMGDAYAMAFGNVPVPRFVVRQDTDSDNYGIAIFNTLVSERSKRIELIHYGADNKEINRSFYNSPNEEFKYMELIDFVVIGDQKIVASAFIYNTGDDKISYLSLASLEKGTSGIKVKTLEFTANKKFTSGLMRYNKKADVVAVVGLNYIGKKKSSEYYNPILTLIDPKNLSITFTKDIELPKIKDQYTKIFGPKESYHALPQNLYVNEDGTYTVVFEDIQTKMVGSSNHTTSTVKLQTVAVATLDNTTKEIASYLIPKSQTISYVVYGFGSPYDYDPLYIARRGESAQWLKDGSQYKSFCYVNGKMKSYIFLNDLVENLEKIKNGKLTSVSTVSDTDAFVFSMKDGNMNRDFLFGNPKEDEHSFTLFTVSDYNPSTGVFATMKLENNKGKRMKIVWMNL